MKIWKTTFLLALGPALAGVSARAQEAPLPRSFHRGDADGSGALNITDPIFTFGWLFLGAEAPKCLDAVDSNDDGKADLSDGIFTLSFLFMGGETLPYPGKTACGYDPTEDELDCAAYMPCACGAIVSRPCAEGEFCDVLAGGCGAADVLGSCVEVPAGCPKNLDPVCGCDGVTYGNDCLRLQAQVQKAHDGPCEKRCGGIAGIPCEKEEFCEFPAGSCDVVDNMGTCVKIPGDCLDVFDPVCGCDGVTYGNDCERQRAQAQKAHDGPCEKRCGGIAGFPCDKGEFCDFPPGTCDVADNMGVCVTIPDACPDVFDPVCGCDGQTYSNDCERIQAQVQKSHDGPCERQCGGLLGIPCEKWEFCEFPPGTCFILDNMGNCRVIPGICPAVFDPVCGCDGKTYTNDCVRQAAMVSKDHDGECEGPPPPPGGE